MVGDQTEQLLGRGLEIDSAEYIGRVDKILSRMLGFDNLESFAGDKSKIEKLPWSRSQIDRLVSAGGISINERTVNKGSRTLKVGDIVKIDSDIFAEVGKELKESVAARDFTHTGDKSVVEPENIPLDVVYEDEDVIVVDKPAGMVVHPAYAHPSGTLANAVAGYLERKGQEIPQRVGLVHRLDKDVSGLMLIAKNNRALSILSKQFSGEGIKPGMINNHEDIERVLPHKARKIYWAVVCADGIAELKAAGLGKHHFSKIEGYIRRCRGTGADRKKFEFRQGLDGFEDDDARYCLSFGKVLKKVGDGKYLVEIHIVTGRTHQIRAQLSCLGIPVCEDEKYGGLEKGKDETSCGIRLRAVKMSYIPVGVYGSKGEAEDSEDRYSRNFDENMSENRGKASIIRGKRAERQGGARKIVEKFEIP